MTVFRLSESDASKLAECGICHRIFSSVNGYRTHFATMHPHEPITWDSGRNRRVDSGTQGLAGVAVANARRGEIPIGKTKPRYEKMLADQMIEKGMLGFCGQYEFDAVRNWRIDFAWPAQKLAVEVDGSVHRIKKRFDSDIEKHQALFFAGWRLLRVSTNQVKSGDAVTLIERAL